MMESIENRRLTSDSTTEIQINLDGSTSRMINSIRDKIASLGVAGILIYNAAKATIAGGSAFVLKDGDVSERLLVGGSVAAFAILASTSFWMAIGAVGIRHGYRRIFPKKPEKH